MPLAVPTLTIVDNADGTGATATVAGSTAGTTNAVYTAAWSGGFTPAAFASVGSRVGDGNVALPVAVGYHWAYILSTLAAESAISLVRGFRATTGDPSVFGQCLDAVHAKLQALTLTGIAAGSRLKRMVAFNRNVTCPAVIAAIGNKTRNATPGIMQTNESDVIGYGVGLVFLQAGNQELAYNDAWQLWREEVEHAFEPTPTNDPLAGVAEVIDVRIEEGTTLDISSFTNQYNAQGLTVRCITRERRGLV